MQPCPGNLSSDRWFRTVRKVGDDRQHLDGAQALEKNKSAAR
jgi:hypothetical protein